MSSDETPGGPSAARLGGFALIGVGLLAGVFGIATAVSGAPQDGLQPPDRNVAAPPSQQPEQTAQGQSSPDQSSQDQPPKPTTEQLPKPTTEPGTPSTTPQGQTSEGQPPPSPGQSQPVVVRVYNNSKISGLAHDAAEDFRRAGYAVPEVGNYSEGLIRTTTIYFRPGSGEQAHAKQLADAFGARLEPRFPGLEKASPGVIAIVTKDYQGINGK